MKKPFLFLNRSGRKAVAFLLSTLVLATAFVDVTLAILMVRTDPLENKFVPSTLRISLRVHDDEMLDHTHEDITNIGDVPVYLRAIAVANWVSTEDEHTILSETPVATANAEETDADLYIDFMTEGWFLADDGFYYYEKVLEAGKGVALVLEAEQLKEKAGYELSLEVVSTAIQANPPEAVQEAWPVVAVADDGTLVERGTDR